MADPVQLDQLITRTGGEARRTGQLGTAHTRLHLQRTQDESGSDRAARLKKRRQLKECIEVMDKDPMRAARTALQLVTRHEDDATCNQLMGMALERLGHLSRALEFLERAYTLDPANADIHVNLGVVADKLEMLEAAEKFYRLALHLNPSDSAALINLSGILRARRQFDDAVELLRAALLNDQENVALWNALATVLMDDQRPEEAITFYQEATRLDPHFGRAYHNMALCQMMLGAHQDAVTSLSAALDSGVAVADEPVIRYSRATAYLGLGQLGEGWADHPARLDPRAHGNTLTAIDLPLWTPETQSPPTDLLVVAEQGLGDEVLFGTVLRDLVAEAGPGARIAVAVEPRLVSLFARAFPGVHVGPHVTVGHQGRRVRGVEWASEWGATAHVHLGSLCHRYRRDIDAFDAPALLAPDTGRLNEAQDWLAGLGEGAKVGICWKSMLMTTSRDRYHSPFAHWRSLLQTQGVTFVSLQYGDTDAEIARAAEDWGVTLHSMPGLDLRDDLEGVVALGAAVDIVIGPMNASANMAAATGTETWFLTVKNWWPRLGTDTIPFYPSTRAFAPATFGDWPGVMDEMATALAERFSAD